jgi:hypothetical protein
MELTAVRGLYLEELEDVNLLTDTEDYVLGFLVGADVALIIIGIAC